MNSRRRFQLVLSVLAVAGTAQLHAVSTTDLFGAIGNSDPAPLYGDLISIDLNNNAMGTFVGSPTSQANAISGLAFDNSGTLFANNEAEPELFSPSNGRTDALPGWEADVARQAKVLAKQREKRR